MRVGSPSDLGGTRYEGSGDDHPLDVVGALADGHQGGVAVETFDDELLGVAVAAVDPHGLQGGAQRDLRREVLGHRGLGVHRAGLRAGRRPVGEQARHDGPVALGAKDVVDRRLDVPEQRHHREDEDDERHRAEGAGLRFKHI